MALFGIINRTIFWSVLQAIIAVICVICAIDFLFALLDDMGSINAENTFLDVIYSIVLQLPVRFIEFASVASLIGAIVVLGMMATNSELVVIRAAGWSPVKILFPALVAALMISFMSMGLAQYVVPTTSQLKISHGDLERDPVWFKDGETFARVGRVTPAGDLVNLTLFDVKNETLDRVRFIEYARFDQALGHWVLKQVNNLAFSTDKLVRSVVSRDSWAPSAGPEDLKFLGRDAETLSLTDLVHYIEYRRSQGLDIRRHTLIFWKTMLQPLANAVMVLLASSLVFGSMRMVSMGYRITVGLMYGLGFYYAQDLFGFLSLVYGFHPLPTLMAPLILFGLLALYRFKQTP